MFLVLSISSLLSFFRASTETVTIVRNCFPLCASVCVEDLHRTLDDCQVFKFIAGLTENTGQTSLQLRLITYLIPLLIPWLVQLYA